MRLKTIQIQKRFERLSMQDLKLKSMGILGDKSHKYHNLIIDEVTNHEHKIDSKIPLKWTYTPQHYWINENKLKMLFHLMIGNLSCISFWCIQQ